MEEDMDSVRFYRFRTKDQVTIVTLGVEKADIGCIV